MRRFEQSGGLGQCPAGSRGIPERGVVRSDDLTHNPWPKWLFPPLTFTGNQG
jgi:hypothetical protein